MRIHVNSNSNSNSNNQYVYKQLLFHHHFCFGSWVVHTQSISLKFSDKCIMNENKKLFKEYVRAGEWFFLKHRKFEFAPFYAILYSYRFECVAIIFDSLVYFFLSFSLSMTIRHNQGWRNHGNQRCDCIWFGYDVHRKCASRGIRFMHDDEVRSFD